MAKVNNLESLLASLSEQTAGEDVSVRDMLNAVGRRSYGPILLLLGFIAISPLTIIPGTSWLVALVILLIAGQIVLGRAFPWVPKRFLISPVGACHGRGECPPIRAARGQGAQTASRFAVAAALHQPFGPRLHRCRAGNVSAWIDTLWTSPAQSRGFTLRPWPDST